MSANSPLVNAGRRFADLPSAAVWAPLWAAFASMAWLLPNHYRPWTAFHNDAWAAWAFAAGGGLLLLSSRSPLPLHRLSLLAGTLVVVPGLQWAWGVLPVPGLAWIATLYLLGFVLALVVGARAEQDHPEVAVSALLLAISAAAVASVGLQLHQWLSLEFTLWILPVQEMRFYGNLGQPNQMATLQIWGLLGVGWFLQRRQISSRIALLLALLLLLGIALTQSRTAILSGGVLAVMAIVWRRLWPAPRQIVALAAGLVTWFATCLVSIKPVSEALLLSVSRGSLERSWSGDSRWQAYRMFVDAALEKPWLGYGWATVAPAHLAVADSHPKLSILFEHSHNFFLDLALWLGLPLGLIVSVALVLWLARQIWCVSAPKEAILVMFVAVVGLHAMLELPLQYAYMLLPVALVMGVLQIRSQAQVVVLVSRRMFIGLWLGTVLLLGAVTRDYFLIEADLEALRFEKTYRIEAPAQPPPVLVLSHLSDFIRLGRIGAKPGMTAEEIERTRLGAYWFPSPANLYLYTAALALNGRAEEARQMMRKTANVVGDGHYERMGRAWASQIQGNKSLPGNVPDWLPEQPTRLHRSSIDNFPTAAGPLAASRRNSPVSSAGL
jgi:O-antigen ligase